MSEPLKLPERLSGDWQHCLILTYGADLGFYEATLWRQLARYRNKIVLADGRQLLRSWDEAAAGWGLRHVNRRYVVDALQTPRAAHAKAILLADEHRGRLLVGSGNLGYSGYAAGGEVFTEYAFGPDEPERLDAFGAVWDLVEGLLARGYVGPAAARQLRWLADETPWLARAAARDGAAGPVRHNLRHPFVTQFEEAVAGRGVDALWLAAPFLDHEAEALRAILTRLRPKRAHLLIQEHATSAHPPALERVLRAFPMLDLIPYSADAYVHAKFYLAHVGRRAVCLSGSPNLSAAALLRTDPDGNVELANLVEGERRAFDDLLAPLERRRATRETRALAIGWSSSDAEPEWLRAGWRLLGGEWQDETLLLRWTGARPALVDLALLVGEQAADVELTGADDSTLTLRLSVDAQQTLAATAAPVRLRYGSPPGFVTNAVYVASRRALDLELQSGDIQSAARALSDIELQDAEIETLLEELDAALVISPGGLWKLAGQPVTPEVDSDEGVAFAYADLDDEALRRHPRLQQYLRARQAGRLDQPTRLRLLINSVLGHFDALRTRALTGAWTAPAPPPEPAADPFASAEETERVEAAVDQVAREAERLKRRRAGLITRFVGQFLKGHESQAFRQAVGFEAVVQNALLFNHLLTLFFLKDWVDHLAIAQAWLRLWTGIVGRGDAPGLLASASADDVAWWRELARSQHGPGELIAMTYVIDRFLHDVHFLENIVYDDPDWDVLPDQVRDLWRRILETKPVDVGAADLQDAWEKVASIPSLRGATLAMIVERCARLITHETLDEFEMDLAARTGEHRGRFAFDVQGVEWYRTPLQVRRLIVPRADILDTREAAQRILQDWMRAEKLPYYRVSWLNGGREEIVAFTVVESGEGVYFNRAGMKYPVDLPRLGPAARPWDGPLREWRAMAQRVEAEWVVMKPVRMEAETR